MPMAVQTPTHRKRFFLVNDIHMVHLAVATHATDASVDMHGMIEIRKVRHLVDFHPVHGVPTLPTIPDCGQFGIVGLNLGMTIHTGLRGWYVRVGGNLDVGMAI